MVVALFVAVFLVALFSIGSNPAANPKAGETLVNFLGLWGPTFALGFHFLIFRCYPSRIADRVTIFAIWVCVIASAVQALQSSMAFDQGVGDFVFGVLLISGLVATAPIVIWPAKKR